MSCIQKKQMELIFDRERDGLKREKKVHHIFLALKNKGRQRKRLAILGLMKL